MVRIAAGAARTVSVTPSGPAATAGSRQARDEHVDPLARTAAESGQGSGPRGVAFTQGRVEGVAVGSRTTHVERAGNEASDLVELVHGVSPWMVLAAQRLVAVTTRYSQSLSNEPSSARFESWARATMSSRRLCRPSPGSLDAAVWVGP